MALTRFDFCGKRGDTKIEKYAFVVGLTGGLATGKSTVARMFRRLGAHVTDCDRLAHQALRKGTPTYGAITKCFRGEARNRRGQIVRQKLARLIFQNPKKRRALEAIIHPYVFRQMESRIARHPRGIHILEVPLLFETRYDRHVARVVVVTASREQQIRRASRHLHVAEKEAMRRLRSQRPLSWKVKQADYVIRNDGSLGKTWKQVRWVWNELLNESRSQNESMR